MIMKVFGITVNKRKPCTKEQTERGDETEKDCESGTMWSITVILWDTKLSIITRFIFFIPEQ